jgi:hypothetical protein
MFNLEAVSELILKEVKKGAYLHKNQVFANQNFEKVYQDIGTINELTSSFNSNETSMPQDTSEPSSLPSPKNMQNKFASKYENLSLDSQTYSYQNLSFKSQSTNV